MRIPGCLTHRSPLLVAYLYYANDRRQHIFRCACIDHQDILFAVDNVSFKLDDTDLNGLVSGNRIPPQVLEHIPNMFKPISARERLQWHLARAQQREAVAS